MKKFIPLILFFILTGFVYAEEKVAITSKSGITYHWDNYFEKDNNYCTMKSYGEFCVQKSNIASIIKGEEEKLPPVKKVNLNDPRVIQQNKKWQEEYEATVFAKQLEKLGEENKKYELEKLRTEMLLKSIELNAQLKATEASAIKKAERRARRAESDASSAESKARRAESDARSAESKARAAEQRASELEHRARVKANDNWLDKQLQKQW
ncbi:MAG: hypothetical protein A2W05_03960 [Candidatus Schekmanbacteria bacterium RBG_16_38_10]|uniref:Uncharacterized protein n=1 Tax=Candidatus Schekmanbacteria bacterium RBG_16_38_10 TaxID=1817879 RepID=A0A1F7RW34_9BACT|nr:MAG: hypothetical protein A2W05_03960 [Candidatus Schekmanbacteria bacterium RBG_16_38_10]